MSRFKTFEATGVAPNGRLYAGDLNAIQDRFADLSDFAQVVDVGTLRVGETGLQLLRFGSGEARISGLLRTDGLLRGLGGLVPGAFTDAARNAIGAGLAPKGTMIYNSTNDEVQINVGSDGARIWHKLIATVPTDVSFGRLVGEMIPYAPNVANLTGIQEPEAGWLLCNGAAISRSTYATLFGKISEDYGDGDNSTTFNLPDCKDGRIPIPRGGTSFTVLGQAGGEINHALVTGELAVHSHSISQVGDHAHAPPSNQFAITDAPPIAVNTQAGGNHTGILAHYGSTAAAGGHNHGGATGNQGSGTPHNTMQPYQVVGGILIKY